MDAELSVEEVSMEINTYRERLRVLSYRVMLDVPGGLVLYVAKLLLARRREIGTPARQPGAFLLAAGGLHAGMVP